MSPVLFVHDELPSTHEYAISMLSKTKPREATVIVTGKQYAGKGRYDRKWSSQDNSNVLLSCILYPLHLKISQAFFLNIISTLATTSLLAEHSISSIQIKWPNDVFVNQKKVAGTLIQNQFSGATLASAIVSIGLNVNQLKWSDQIQATSMQAQTEVVYDVVEIARAWINALLSYYQISQTRSGITNLKNEWKQQLLGFNVESTFSHVEKGRFQATLIDVLDDGMLVLLRNGASEQYHMDEIRHQPDIQY